jgi:hypothetical protein
MDKYTSTAPAVNPALKRRPKNGSTTSAPRSVSHLIQAWTRATPAERAEFGRAIGVNVVWDDAVAPNLV